MASTSRVDVYLDKVCSRLQVNPAEADDLREELHGHLEELVSSYSAGGADHNEAVDLALAWFGDAHKLHDTLDIVYQGDPWWLSRLKGLLLGGIFGILLITLIPFGGHFEFVTRLIPCLLKLPIPSADLLLNAFLVGAAIGLISSRGRGLLAGWMTGSLIWLFEYAFYWMSIVAGNEAYESSNMLFSLLVSPLLGGIFGAAVGIATATTLSRFSSARPEIR